jgi:hypothetical protein
MIGGLGENASAIRIRLDPFEERVDVRYPKHHTMSPGALPGRGSGIGVSSRLGDDERSIAMHQLTAMVADA